MSDDDLILDAATVIAMTDDLVLDAEAIIGSNGVRVSEHQIEEAARTLHHRHDDGGAPWCDPCLDDARVCFRAAGFETPV